MSLVAVTDYSFDALDVEKAKLEPLGCRFVALKKGKEPAELRSLVREADYVLTQFSPVTAEVIGAMQRCRLIVRYGIGVDNVDLGAAAAKKIPVCNVPDYCTDEVADHALAMILALTRRVDENSAAVKAGKWALAVPVESMRVLREMTVGLVGFGRIGREVAARLRPFKCRILVADPGVPAERVRQEGFQPVSLPELFEQSDLVSLHLPSTPETRGMIDAGALERMKRGALLVNASRGTLVKTPDLVAALRSGLVGAAALDVTDPEPIEPGSPLLGMSNVLINSHVASVSRPAVEKLRDGVAETVAIALRGEKLPNVVNGVSA